MSVFEKGKAYSSQLLKQLVSESPDAIPLLNQANLGRQILTKIATEIIGYDFFGLLTKLLFYYTFAFLINQYFRAVIFGSGIIQTAATLFGIKLDTALSNTVKQFFTSGFRIKIGLPDANLGQMYILMSFWDVVNILGFFLVSGEAFAYYNTNKKAGGQFSWFTVGIFSLVIAGLGMIAFAKLFQRYNVIQKILALEAKAFQQQRDGDTRGALATLQAASVLITGTSGILQVPVNTTTVTP